MEKDPELASVHGLALRHVRCDDGPFVVGGIGVVGVNWNAKVMAIKFLGADGSGTTADAIDAIITTMNVT